MEYQAFGDQYVLKLDPGEELVSTLCEFVRRQGIRGGYFLAFGAFERVTLQYFDWQSKQYLENPVHRQVEVVSLMGNIAWQDGTPKLHIHGAFGDREAKTYSGHVSSGVVRPTLELFLTALPGELHRTRDPATGLDLLSFGAGNREAANEGGWREALLEDADEETDEAVRTGERSAPYTP